MSMTWGPNAASEQEHYDYLREFHNAALVDGITEQSSTLVERVCDTVDYHLYMQAHAARGIA
jgi:hypothetical protein